MTKHTPTPWIQSNGMLICEKSCGGFIADVQSAKEDPTDKTYALDCANAEFIIRACNALDELRIAAKYALHALETGTSSEAEHDQLINQLYQAIAKAEEKSEKLTQKEEAEEAALRS